jgi:hypothetical protein|tara:strand:- start:11110 stop:11658 length:549 start_codon:yes stop_codon:yes gene_type:complete
MELTSGNNNVSELQGQRITDIDYAEAKEKWLTDLDWRLIHTAMTHSDFNGSPIWLAKKLNQALDKVTEALYGLISLGIVEIKDSKFQRTVDHYFLTSEEFGEDRIIAAYKDLTLQHLSKLTTGSQRGTSFYTLATTNESVTKCKSKIRDAVRELVEESKNTKDENFYTLSISINHVESGKEG